MKNSPESKPLRWMRRLIAVLIIGLTLIIILALNGYHTGWVGMVMSFIFAEMTRRISGENSPNGPMSWWAILTFAWGKELHSDHSNNTTRDKE